MTSDWYQITPDDLRRRPWAVYADGEVRQLRITSVSGDGAIAGTLMGYKIFGGVDWKTGAIVFRQGYDDIRYIRAHRGFAFVMKRGSMEKWVMSGTFLTYEPECATPWRQEFGCFAEQR